MTKRRKKSRGQALIMVTLGLIALCGMMGLAVDLGWSFFVEKQAQAAADAAALAAAQEGMRDLGGAAATIVCDAVVYCAPAPVRCSSLSGDSNLAYGCMYAQQNGFADGGMGGRQTVTIQADVTIPPPTAPNVNGVRYWVTVRTTQTVPQLFSAVLGNPEGTVSAIATAAIAASIVPGSFFGLNREGDCIATGNSRVGFDEYCGVDVRTQGGGGTSARPCPGSGSPGVNARLCAADGISLSSTCHGDSSQKGCVGTDSDTKRGSWAGMTQGVGQATAVWSSGAQIRDDPTLPAVGAVDTPSHWDPRPVASQDQSIFRDPFEGRSQPPLVASSPIGLCGVLNGQITGSTNPNAPQSIGPYLYYAYDNNGPGGTRRATGQPLRIIGNVSFNASAPCSNAHPTGTEPPTGGLDQSGSAFPMYMFYGGLSLDGESMHFGPGEYVMVGTNNREGAALAYGGGNRQVTGDSNAGTLFITTAPQSPGGGSYPGLETQLTELYSRYPALNPNSGGTLAATKQGHVEIKAGSGGGTPRVQLRGINPKAMPPSVGDLFVDHENVLIWQDRRNSTMLFNADGTVASRPCESGCATIPSSLANNGVTEYSPEFIFDSALGLNLNGVIYQPRGAWFSFSANADTSSSLTVVTGMLYMQGNGQMALLPVGGEIIQYVVALIH